GERKKTKVTTKNVIVAAQPSGGGGDGRYLDHSAANTIAMPCNVPQRTKFQPAPCHRPQRVMVKTIAQKCCIARYRRATSRISASRRNTRSRRNSVSVMCQRCHSS